MGQENPLLTNACAPHVTMTPDEVSKINKVYSYLIGDKDDISFTILMSLTVFLYSIIMIYKLKGL